VGGYRITSFVEAIRKTVKEGVSPFYNGLFRATVGIILQMMVIGAYMPDKFDIILPCVCPLTAMTFLTLILGASGILLSGYIFTMFIELMVLTIIWFIKKIFFHNSLEGNKQ